MRPTHHLPKESEPDLPPRTIASIRPRIYRMAAALLLVSVCVSHPGYADEWPSDELLTLAVENELLQDDAINCSGLEVHVQEGVVTLSGRAENLRSRQRATRIAKMLRGVRSVVNHIILLPPQRSDRLLTLDVEHALQQNAATEAYDVIAVVQEGIARLGGTVQSQAEKRLAGYVASGVNGIVDVDNRLLVKSSVERSDEEQLADIRGLLAASPWLEDSTIEVAVSDGNVVLTGAVGTLDERDRARSIAFVAGVKAVDVRGLRIDPTIRNGIRRRQRYAVLSDEQIAESVRLTLRHDPRVLSFANDIEVESRNAVVTLRGQVGHALAKRSAENAAKNTLGVDRVRSRIDVAWDHDIDDGEIEGYVRAALQRNPWVSRRDILIRCQRAHVDLFGLVDSKFEKQAAQQTAEMQQGVVHVNNYLTVINKWEPRTDDEIEQAIEEKLKWTFFDRASEIEVRVDNGVALLQRTVDTRRQWQHVMEIAVNAGARKPHNQLRVRLQPQQDRNPLYVPMHSDAASVRVLKRDGSEIQDD